MQTIPSRVQKFLLRRCRKGRGVFQGLSDWRQRAKVKHQLPAVAHALLLALMANRRTLRDAEDLTGALRGPWRALVPKRISDTTLDDVLRRLSHEELQQSLVALNRELKRSKLLSRSPELPVNLVLVDGKNLATLSHAAAGTAQPRGTDNEKWQHKGAKADGAAYWLAPALRATLANTEARPCLLQMPLPPHSNETATFKSFLAEVLRNYGRNDVLDVISCDAGLTSLSNADAIHNANLRYVMGLKENQTELFEEASRLFLSKTVAQPPEAETCWERRGSAMIRRLLWRSSAFKGFENSVGKWGHLEQVWLVRQQTRTAQGETTFEDRYFLSSVPEDELEARQILLVVRRHWVIENDVFNSLDLQWREDSGPWCTQGGAVWVLAVLRLMAYNLVQCLRRRTCREKRGRRWLDPMPWRRLFEHIYDALRGYGMAPQTD
jgi:hypothetical protein